MSLIERTRGEPPTGPPRRGRSLLGTLAIGCAGIFLLSTAFQASFASGRASAHGYFPPGGSGADGDDNFGTEDVVLIVVGGAAVAGLVTGIIGGQRSEGESDAAAVPTGGGSATVALDTGFVSESKGALPALPADHTEVSQVRLTPRQSRLFCGTTQSFQLEGKSARVGVWYSVTQRPEATVALAKPDAALVKQEGAKNLFSVPLTALDACKGQRVKVVGTFAPRGHRRLQAATSVVIAAPGA